MKVEDEVDTTDGGRNSASNLMIPGLLIIGFLERVGDGDGGELSSSVAVGVAPADGVPYPSSCARAKTAEMSPTAGRSRLGVHSVVASETWESGRAMTCFEEGRNIDVVIDAEDLGRGKGEIGPFPIPLRARDTERTMVASLSRAEEEATLRSLDIPVRPPAVVSRLALVKIGLRFALEAAGLGTLAVTRA
jgi:hypothetical protein